MIKMITVIV